MNWTAVSNYELVWRSWSDDEHVVYHAGSGDTHLLNRIAAVALRKLQLQAYASSALAAAVAREVGMAVDREFVAHIEQLLAQFDELGLVEPVP